MKCPICGCENPDDYKFCHDCGSPLNFTESIDDLTDELNNLDDFPSLDSKKLIIIIWIYRIHWIIFPRFYAKQQGFKY